MLSSVEDTLMGRGAETAACITTLFKKGVPDRLSFFTSALTGPIVDTGTCEHRTQKSGHYLFSQNIVAEMGKTGILGYYDPGY